MLAGAGLAVINNCRRTSREPRAQTNELCSQPSLIAQIVNCLADVPEHRRRFARRALPDAEDRSFRSIVSAPPVESPVITCIMRMAIQFESGRTSQKISLYSETTCCKSNLPRDSM